LRDDAPALAVRGITMAQPGDLTRARELLRSAARAFGPKEPMARARCVVAEAEIALFRVIWGGLRKCSRFNRTSRSDPRRSMLSRLARVAAQACKTRRTDIKP
jgi:hypothetical protein